MEIERLSLFKESAQLRNIDFAVSLFKGVTYSLLDGICFHLLTSTSPRKNPERNLQ